MPRLRFSVLLVLSVFCFCLKSFAEPPPIEMTPSSGEISPVTAFQIRFSDAMAASELVGKPDAASPISFDPPVAGSFLWLDVRHGVFTPSDPLPLQTEFKVSLSDKFSKADGQALLETWSAAFRTEPLILVKAIRVGWNAWWDDQATPGVLLSFNSDVVAESANPSLAFVDGKGNRVAALTEKPTEAMSGRIIYGGNGRITWASWQPHNGLRGEIDARQQRRLLDSQELLVKPAHALQPGVWNLFVDKGLPDQRCTGGLPETTRIEVAEVAPFTVAEIKAVNVIGHGKTAEIRFSKSIAESKVASDLGNWIKVEPAVGNPGFEQWWNGVNVPGDFELGKTYHITVGTGFPARDGATLEKPFEQDITFEPIPPRLYFEEFAVHQLASGSRQFHLLAVNVPAVQVEARLFTGAAVPKAFEAWQRYYRGWNGRGWNNEEPYLQVEGDKIPGRKVYAHTFATEAGADGQKELALDWNEILGQGRTGVVLLCAEEPSDAGEGGTQRPAAQALVQVTDLGMVWKENRREQFLYVFSLASGRPVEGATVQALDEKNAVLAEGKTDVSGAVRIKKDERFRWMLVRHGDDVHLLADDEMNEIDLTRFRRYSDGSEIDRDEEENRDVSERKIFVFTDRGVYRPGDAVHVKGIMRDFSGRSMKIPAGEQLRLEVIDAEQETSIARTVELSGTGAFDADFTLTSGSVGSYTIMVKEKTLPQREEDTNYLAQRVIEVQEYTPNAFEVTANGPSRLLADAGASMEIGASYYMGKALSKAQLKWSLRADDAGFAPEGFGDFIFCSGIMDYRLLQQLDRVGDFSQQGTADLGENGRAAVPVAIPRNAKQPQPRTARLLCEVTDLDQQTVSAEHDFKVDSSDFYLGIRQIPNVVHEGEAISLPIVAVRSDGQPVSESIQIQVRVTRIDWQTNRVEGAGNASNYRSEPEYQVISEVSTQTSPVVKHGHKWTVDDVAPASFTFSAGKPGEYLLEVSAKDAGGRPIVTTTNVFVYGASETAWNYRNPFQIDLVPDKESYLVGDHAIILVKTPISGDALVTVERESVRRSFVQRLSGNAPAIEIPLEESDAPNVYVSVMLLRGADESTHQYKKPEYRVGYARLTVERPEAKLRVYVQPDRPTHEPGEPVAISAEVLDYLGKPVSGAELTLYAVDEGVLSLTGYETPDISTCFNAERGLAVYTGLTLPQLLSEDPDERQYANKGFLVGGGGEDRLRKNFLACAFWAGTLKTGPDGRVTANFTAPDGLTRYRLMAVAQTAKNQFGSGDSSLEINKPVMIEPAPPRFGNVGDKMLLRALVHNTTEFAGRAEIDFALDDTVSAQETCRAVELGARGSAAVDLPVEFIKAGEAVWRWKVNFVAADGATAFHDAAEVKLHVGYPTPATREVRWVKINQRETNLLDQIEPKLLQGAAGTVTVSISNSRVLELGEAIHDLLHYPYGCVEQTTSSTLPWITLRDFRDSLPDLRESDEHIERMVGAGVNRLLTMQTDSGGLAYWPGETEPLLWASAYGGLGLIEAKNAGYAVPKESLERLWKYMSEALRGTAEANDPAQFSERCLALYTLALAGRAEPAYQEVLFEKRAQLSRENRSLLALAILTSGGARSMAAELLDSIENAPINAEDFHWFGSESRAIATELLAGVRFDPKGAKAQRLVSDLFAQSAHGRWLTTQGNAWAILAFGEYVRESKSLTEKISGDVTCGADTRAFSIDQENHAAPVVWPLSAAAKAGKISLVDPEAESCFAEVQIESHPSTIEESQSEHGYTLSRHYYKLSQEGKLEPLRDLTVGDRVVVALHLEVKDFAEYLALDDSLPSVLEAINPAFKTQATTDGDLVNSNWFDDHHELRADRALFFRDHIWPGNYTISYLARVRAAGTVTAPAARVQEMYHPERFGQTETMQMTAGPLR